MADLSNVFNVPLDFGRALGGAVGDVLIAAFNFGQSTGQNIGAPFAAIGSVGPAPPSGSPFLTALQQIGVGEAFINFGPPPAPPMLVLLPVPPALPPFVAPAAPPQPPPVQPPAATPISPPATPAAFGPPELLPAPQALPGPYANFLSVYDLFPVPPQPGAPVPSPGPQVGPPQYPRTGPGAPNLGQYDPNRPTDYGFTQAEANVILANFNIDWSTTAGVDQALNILAHAAVARADNGGQLAILENFYAAQRQASLTAGLNINTLNQQNARERALEDAVRAEIAAEERQASLTAGQNVSVPELLPPPQLAPWAPGQGGVQPADPIGKPLTPFGPAVGWGTTLGQIGQGIVSSLSPPPPPPPPPAG